MLCSAGDETPESRALSFVGRFFLLVVAVGFVEVYLLVAVAARLGFFATAGLCVLTGVIGGALVRHQGLRTLQEIQRAFAEQRVPAVEIASGVVLLVVGVALIAPGFVTDALGFAMLVPPVRLAVAALIARAWERRVAAARIIGAPGRGAHGERRGTVIDVDPEPP